MPTGRLPNTDQAGITQSGSATISGTLRLLYITKKVRVVLPRFYMYKNVSLAIASLIAILTITAAAVAAPVVLFDESHAQQFLVGKDGPLDLSELAAVYRENGLEVKTSLGPLNGAELSSVDMLVLSGPFRPLGKDEVKVVLDFVNNGGGLVVMLHIPPPVLGLLRQLDVDVATGTLHEEEAVIGGNPLYFKVSRLAVHPLFEGLASFSVYGSWALRGAADHVAILAETGPNGWIDLDHDNLFSKADAKQPFGVVVAGQLGQGRYVVFGDDALFQNRFLDESNKRLALNLVNWLSSR